MAPGSATRPWPPEAACGGAASAPGQCEPPVSAVPAVAACSRWPYPADASPVQREYRGHVPAGLGTGL